MKRLWITVLLSCIMLSGCSKGYTKMDVISSHSMTTENWYELDVNVIVDGDTASDKDTCSKAIIQCILDNGFHNTHFPFDINGYPNKISVNVFTFEKDLQKSKKIFSFGYITEFNTEDIGTQNNIRDNPGKFKIYYE